MCHGRDHFVLILADQLVVILQLSPEPKLLIQTRMDSLNSLWLWWWMCHLLCKARDEYVKAT